MRIEVLYFDGCPNHEALLPRLRELLAREGSPAEIDLRRIADDEAAQRERFLGSPTVRVNDRDVEPGAEQRTDFGLKCRLYRTPAGLSGQPEEEWLRAALQIDALAERLTAAMPRLDATGQRVALTLIRQLALGAPVSASLLAGAAKVSEAQITSTLDDLPGVFRDQGQRVVGFMGLSVVEMGQHRIHLDGRTLSAWCAWDTLFLPELLDQTASVSSRSPTSGAEISLTVTPAGPTGLSPAGTVVSFRLPESEFDAGVIQSFCRFVHFFTSPAEGQRWTAEHPGTFLLAVEDAYRLGQLTNRAAFGAALLPGGR